MNVNDVWTYIGRTSIVISIFTFFIAVYGWVKLRLYERNRKILMRQITEQHKKYTNGVLILSLGGASIKTDVMNFINNNDELKDSINEDLILCVDREKRIKAEDMDGLIKDIKEVRKKMMEAGVNKIHFFAFGACVGVGIVGAVFSNGCPLIYYKKTETTYESFGPIERN